MKMSGICSLFPPFGDPWPSCLLPSQTFVSKVMSLLFKTLSRFIIALLPRSKQASFNLMTAVTICSEFGAQENKVCHCFHYFFIYLHEVMVLDAMILVFGMSSFKPTFPLSSFTFIKRFFFIFCHKGGVICMSEDFDISPGSLDFSLCFSQPDISHGVRL